MDVRPAVALVLAALVAVLITAPPATAQTDGEAPPAAGSTLPDPIPPGYFPPTPAGYSVSARQAVAIADTDRNVVEQTVRHGRLTTAIQTKDNTTWQVGYKAGDDEVVQVLVDGTTGAIRESWTGEQVAWPMARGYVDQFGHKLNAPWVWLPLSALFFLALLDWRRPWRIVHLDLLVLLSFGVSHVFFNRGEIGVSVPLVYPVLAYLLARMLWIGFRGTEPLRPSVPAFWLAIATVFLIVFRVTLNVADSGVIDVGYAGTIGADRLTHGEVIWGEDAFPEDNRFGDTYGPVNYYAYLPFELALPWSGEWDELPASHAAAIAFDLATVLGLFAFGLRARRTAAGRALGAISPSPGSRSLHDLRDAVELQRHADRGAPGLEPGRLRPPARARRAPRRGHLDEVRAARSRALVRRGRTRAARTEHKRSARLPEYKRSARLLGFASGGGRVSRRDDQQVARAPSAWPSSRRRS